jgi:hypothetical protein
MALYARCKSDVDTKWWDHQSRTASENWKDLRIAPATVSLSINPAGHTKDRFAPSDAWVKYIAALNGGRNSEEYTALVRKGGSWNINGTLEHPKLESLSFWGAVLEIESLHDKYAKIKTLNAKADPPSAEAVNYLNQPQYVHQFTAIDDKGKMHLLADGLRAYSVMVSVGDLYVPLDRIEFFPSLPRQVYLNTDLNTYETPPTNGNHKRKATKLVRGQTVRIVKYAVRGTDVWARTLQGWIALCVGSPSRFLTSWKMHTRPAK